LAAAIPGLIYSRQGILGGWRLATSGTYAAGAGMFDLTTANAFTGCADLSSYQDGKHLLWASDGTNTLLARISATAPGGETLGEELLANPGFEGVYSSGVAPNWVRVRGTFTESATVHGGSAAQQLSNHAGNSAYGMSNAIALTTGQLVKNTGYQKTVAGSGGRISFSMGSAPYTTIIPAINLDNADYSLFSLYGTSISTGNYVSDILALTNASADVNQTLFDDLSVKQVLSPSTTGALLLGSTGARGYISLSASFNPNVAGSFKVFKAY